MDSGAFCRRVCRSVHGGVVENHKLMIGAQADVKLEVTNADALGVGKTCQGIFRGFALCTAMSI